MSVVAKPIPAAAEASKGPQTIRETVEAPDSPKPIHKAPKAPTASTAAPKAASTAAPKGPTGAPKAAAAAAKAAGSAPAPIPVSGPSQERLKAQRKHEDSEREGLMTMLHTWKISYELQQKASNENNSVAAIKTRMDELQEHFVRLHVEHERMETASTQCMLAFQKHMVEMDARVTSFIDRHEKRYTDIEAFMFRLMNRTGGFEVSPTTSEAAMNPTVKLDGSATVKLQTDEKVEPITQLRERLDGGNYHRTRRDPNELVESVKHVWPEALSYDDISGHDNLKSCIPSVRPGNIAEQLMHLDDQRLSEKLCNLQDAMVSTGCDYNTWPLVATCYLKDEFSSVAKWSKKVRPTWLGLVSKIIDTAGRESFIKRSGVDLELFNTRYLHTDDIKLTVPQLIVATQKASPAWASESKRLSIAKGLLKEYAPTIALAAEGSDPDGSMDLDDWCGMVLDLVTD